jgi:hypothetical protein
MALHILGAGVAIFVLGAASMSLLRATTPLLRRTLRPIVRTAVKEGVVIRRGVQAVVQEARQDIESLTAEARAEIDRQEQHEKGDEKSSSVKM